MKKDRSLYFKQYRENNKEKLLEVQRKYRKNNRDKVNANARRYRKSNGKNKGILAKNKFITKIKQQYLEYMSDKKCERCGFDDQRALAWHHKDPKTKKKCVSILVPGGYSWKTILAEIAKCECLCQNCHAIEHYGEHKHKGDPAKSKDVRVLYKIFMKNQKCNRCAVDNPGALEWHHKDPVTKKYTISSMVRDRMLWEEILEEISKCECLCRRCHHIETHYSSDAKMADDVGGLP
jgi:hypothetical protein